MFRGYEITNSDGVYMFLDSGKSVSETWRVRPCGHCGLHNTSEGHDGCLGAIPGAMNACCGHGVPAEAYIQFHDGSRISGGDVQRFCERKRHQIRSANRIEES